MSESFSEPVEGDRAEPDTARDDSQTEPGPEAEQVGRVGGDDVGYAEEQGSEVRARESDEP